MAAPSYVNLGGAVAVGASCIPPYPACTAGNLLLLFVSSDASGIGSPPAGWTALGSVQTGGGTSVMAWWKIANGTESGTQQVTVTSGTKGAAWITQYAPAAGGQLVAQAYSPASDTSNTTTAFSATGASWTSAVDDRIVASFASAAPSGAYTGNATGQTLTQVSATVTTTARFAGLTPVGTNTIAYGHGDAAVTAGGTGAPTFAATTVGANAAGSVALTLIREIPRTPRPPLPIARTAVGRAGNY